MASRLLDEREHDGGTYDWGPKAAAFSLSALVQPLKRIEMRLYALWNPHQSISTTAHGAFDVNTTGPEGRGSGGVRWSRDSLRAKARPDLVNIRMVGCPESEQGWELLLTKVMAPKGLPGSLKSTEVWSPLAWQTGTDVALAGDGEVVICDASATNPSSEIIAPAIARRRNTRYAVRTWFILERYNSPSWSTNQSTGSGTGCHTFVVIRAVTIVAHGVLFLPDPRPFEMALATLNADASSCVHVGDPWHCDVVGARNVGMGAIDVDPLQLCHESDHRHVSSFAAFVNELLGENELPLFTQN